MTHPLTWRWMRTGNAVLHKLKTEQHGAFYAYIAISYTYAWSNTFLSLLTCSGSDFAFLERNCVKVLLAKQSALRLVAGCKHASRAFDSAT